MKCYSIDKALEIVRKKYPTATREGSTFDWSFWLDGELVATAIMYRRMKRDCWELIVFEKPRVV